MKRAIGWLKFKGILDMGNVLAERLFPYLLVIDSHINLQKQAVLVPIPLHARKERERGFNQSRVIAEALSKMSNIPLGDILIRNRSTWSQKNLPQNMRWSNMEEAFEMTPGIHSRPYAIVIDDVTTTGATISSAAKTLQNAGFKEVWGMTVARD